MKQGEAQYLGGRIGQLEIDKAILLQDLKEAQQEIEKLKEAKEDGDNREH